MLKDEYKVYEEKMKKSIEAVADGLRHRARRPRQRRPCSTASASTITAPPPPSSRSRPSPRPIPGRSPISPWDAFRR